MISNICMLIIFFKARWYKGSIYGMYPRGFLNFIFTNKEQAKPIVDILTESGKILLPEEFLFSTFAYNSHLGAPGSCIAPQSLTEMNQGYLGRYIQRTSWPEVVCTTEIVQEVCILGLPHVEVLKRSSHLIANKFQANFQPEAYDMLEQWYFEKWKEEVKVNSIARSHFNPDIYARLTCTQNHI